MCVSMYKLLVLKIYQRDDSNVALMMWRGWFSVIDMLGVCLVAVFDNGNDGGDGTSDDA